MHNIFKEKKYVDLTKRELDVLFLMLKGFANNEIAEKLVVTDYAIKKHINNIYSKFYLEDYNNKYKRSKLLSYFIKLSYNELMLELKSYKK